jgi:hypothetical protein
VETEVLAHMWHEGWGWGVGGFVLMILMMGLFWAAIIATAVWAIRRLSPRDAHTGGAPTTAMRVHGSHVGRLTLTSSSGAGKSCAVIERVGTGRSKDLQVADSDRRLAVRRRLSVRPMPR